MSRAFAVTCWQCGGYGVTGRFINRNIHITFDCPTCGGRGSKMLRRYKR